MYIHTIGPSDSPKFAMKQNNPSNTKNTDIFGELSIKKKPKAIMRLVTTAPAVPTCRIVFLPYLESKAELIRAVMTCSRLIIEGRTGLKDDRFPSAI
jgi:hypothetical protein